MHLRRCSPDRHMGNNMAFKDGDFLEVEYTVWNAGDSSIIATTDEKKAKESDTFNEKTHYGPTLLVVGSSGMIRGLDREVRGMKENEVKKFTFGPADAFGERVEELVRVMPLSAFKERNISPYPGMQVELDSTTAIVKSVTSGRVTVDANHPYAGKDVIYEVRVVRLLQSEKDKVGALAQSYSLKPTQINAYSDTVELFFDNKVAKNADYFISKASFVASAFTYFKSMKKVDVKEEYLRPEEAHTDRDGAKK